MLFVKLFLSFTLCCSYTVLAQVKKQKPCLNFPSIKNFKADNYKGYWIAWAKTSDENDIANTSCLSYNLGKIENGYWHYTYFFFNDIDKKPHGVKIKLKILGPGKLKRESDGKVFTFLDTGYKNAFNLYGCMVKDNARLDTVHVMTRSNSPTPDEAFGSLGVLDKNGIFYRKDLKTPDIRKCDKVDWSKAIIKKQ